MVEQGHKITESVKRVWNVFFNPEKTFSSLGEKITWKDLWFPVLLLVLASMVTIQLTHPIQVKESTQMIARLDNLTDQQKEVMLQRLSPDKVPIQNLIMGGLTPIISAFFIAVIYLFVGNFFGGGYAKYITLLATTLYISMVDVLASIVKVPIMLAQQTMMVHTSLAMFFPDFDLGNVWFRLAMQVDIFKIWKWILWIIAFKVIYHYSPKKAFILTGIIWLLGAIFTVIIQGYSIIA
ncbi:MAG: YIP1 family protein [Candidatus Marinimicrobia bacterium]|nr:YIP1 family protein [Candidatus Neomarinimicrobiota bacterium]MDD5581697.1 YIP1 family protein [Candidatus Neomarinimicrobiota bacterium]